MTRVHPDQKDPDDVNVNVEGNDNHDHLPQKSNFNIPQDFIAPQNPGNSGSYRPEQGEARARDDKSSSPVVYTPSTPSRWDEYEGRDSVDERAGENAPLMGNDAPPPSYEAGMQHSAYTGEYRDNHGHHAHHHDGYGTTENVGRATFFDPEIQPQSMSDPPSQEGRSPRARWLSRGRDRFKVKHIMMVVLVVFIFAWLIVGIIDASKHRRHFGPGGDYKHGEEDWSSFPDDNLVSNPRRIHIHESSNSVTGNFPLFDLLAITTTSGSVSITIDPQAADPSHPDTPAVLFIKTSSGSVDVDFKTFPWPEAETDTDPPPNIDISSTSPLYTRLYTINIETSSGAISATLLHGQKTILHSKSGSITTTHIPVFPNGTELPSYIETISHSGATNVRVRDPPIHYFHHTTPAGSSSASSQVSLSNLTASHLSVGSASLDVEYPPSWEGKLVAQRRNPGSVDIGGEGLNVWRGSHNLFRGQKGEGESQVFLRAGGSGSLRFWVVD